jgi:hypothetical protein
VHRLPRHDTPTFAHHNYVTKGSYRGGRDAGGACKAPRSQRLRGARAGVTSRGGYARTGAIRVVRVLALADPKFDEIHFFSYLFAALQPARHVGTATVQRRALIRGGDRWCDRIRPIAR